MSDLWWWSAFFYGVASGLAVAFLIVLLAWRRFLRRPPT